VAEVVVLLGLAKAGFLSGCTVVLGIVAATEERSEDAYCSFMRALARGRRPLPECAFTC
jgi:hypothetical protein